MNPGYRLTAMTDLADQIKTDWHKHLWQYPTVSGKDYSKPDNTNLLSGIVFCLMFPPLT